MVSLAGSVLSSSHFLLGLILPRRNHHVDRLAISANRCQRRAGFRISGSDTSRPEVW